MAFFKGIISKLSSGLARTREALVSGLRRLLVGRALDESLLAEVERALLAADAGPAAARALIDGLRADFASGAIRSSEEVLPHLKARCKALLARPATSPAAEFNFAPAPPTVILVTGINGAGKTTSIAKLAKRLRDQNHSVILAAADTFRAGAVRQLEIWAERLGVELIKGQQGGDPAAVAFDAVKAAQARRASVLIIDTAGRLHTQDPLMRQLAKIRSVIDRQIPGAPHETLLVLDATSGLNALRQAQEFSKALGGLSGILLAKLDGTAKGGVVLAIAADSHIPVRFVGVGETPDDLEPFDPDAFVEALFADEPRPTYPP